MPSHNRHFSRALILLITASALAGCTMFGGGNDTDIAPAPGPSSARTMTGLSAVEIRTILAGKSWRFTGPNNTGTTLYAADGTSLVEVDGKGTTKGKWTTQDGQLCESFDPAPFLPNGVPMSCYTFSGSGGTYQAGKATFTEAG